MLVKIIEGAGNAEEDILKFIAEIAEVDVNEVKNDEFEILSNVIDHLQDQPKLNAFLSKAFQLAK